MAFAQELEQEHLVGASEELLALCAGKASTNGLTQKNQLLSLVSRLKGCTAGLGSNMPDFDAPGGADHSTSLVVSGQV